MFERSGRTLVIEDSTVSTTKFLKVDVDHCWLCSPREIGVVPAWKASTENSQDRRGVVDTDFYTSPVRSRLRKQSSMAGRRLKIGLPNLTGWTKCAVEEDYGGRRGDWGGIGGNGMKEKASSNCAGQVLLLRARIRIRIMGREGEWVSRGR